MELIPELLKQAGLGFTTATFIWLFIQERKEHTETRKANANLQEARRLDAVESRTEVTSLLPGISQSLANISDKIEISKESRGRR